MSVGIKLTRTETSLVFVSCVTGGSALICGWKSGCTHTQLSYCLLFSGLRGWPPLRLTTSMSVIGGPEAPAVCERGSEGSAFQMLILQDCKHTCIMHHCCCSLFIALFLSVGNVASSWSSDTAVGFNPQTIDGWIAVPCLVLPPRLAGGVKAIYGFASTEMEAANCDPIWVKKKCLKSILSSCKRTFPLKHFNERMLALPG